ncbi:unnamed protein product [Caenorhabditis sp. 36 PRJEB53466]|nr:unnamed protein product [Caenorhabditis sp. 36 PRJEB53466]
MCNVALVLNGSPKGWARVKKIDNFMEKGNMFGQKDGPHIEMIQNSEPLENSTSAEQHRSLGEPYYYQEDGYLVIEDANSYSQGVYFCFDEDSVASQRHFHILIPILPVIHVAKDHIDQIETISGGCSETDRSFPDHYWKDNNKAELFDDQETCFKRNGHNDCGILANWLYGVDSLESCLDTELGADSQIENYDSFFSNVFESVLNVTDTLKMPENAFKYCIKYEKLDGKYDALIGTYSKDEKIC